MLLKGLPHEVIFSFIQCVQSLGGRVMASERPTWKSKTALATLLRHRTGLGTLEVNSHLQVGV